MSKDTSSQDANSVSRIFAEVSEAYGVHADTMLRGFAQDAQKQLSSLPTDQKLKLSVAIPEGEVVSAAMQDKWNIKIRLQAAYTAGERSEHKIFNLIGYLMYPVNPAKKGDSSEVSVSFSAEGTCFEDGETESFEMPKNWHGSYSAAIEKIAAAAAILGRCATYGKIGYVTSVKLAQSAPAQK